MAITLEGSSDYIIFFDDQHIQRFVTSFSVTMSANGGIGEASIEMVYADSFMNIEYMTDVKIFVKNVFNGRYKMVFDGQIHGRQVSMSPTGRHITFIAYDYMFWLQRLPVPLLLGITEQISKNTQLSWVARGVDVRAVQLAITAGAASFAGKNMRGTIEDMFKYIDASLAHSADYNSPDKNNLYRWINIKSRIKVLSDFDPELKDNSMIDLFYKGSIVENAYVLLNGLVSGVGYEFYQDTDGIIKIKEPFWHDGIIKPFVIDPAIIIDFNEDTRWDNKCTRVLALGGVDQIFQPYTSGGGVELDLFVPGVVYVQGENNSYFVTSDDVNKVPVQGLPQDNVKYETSMPDEAVVRYDIVRAAYMLANYRSEGGKAIPYGEGGGHGNFDPSYGLDCSGFIMQCYKSAGINTGNLSADGFFRKSENVKDVGVLKPGDLGFNTPRDGKWGHIGMYAGESTDNAGNTMYVWIDCTIVPEENISGIRVASFNNKKGPWEVFGDFLAAYKGGYSGAGELNMPTGIDFQEKVLPLTTNERKYGVNLFETVQPLIRINHVSKDGGGREAAFELLKNHAKYLHNTINASASVASLTTMGAPWFRPGFNVWVDPGGLSRIYYISSVRHQGSDGVVQTSLGLIYGRSEVEYKYLYNQNKGKPNNPLTETETLTAKDYYLDNGELDFITPSNMDKFKEYKRKIHVACDNKGAIPAHLGPYRDWYGCAFIRRDVYALGRWDSDFNLFELYCIIAANYGVQDVVSLL